MIRLSVDIVCYVDIQVLESLAEQSRQQRLGLNFEGVPDADLFFVDKVGLGAPLLGNIDVGRILCYTCYATVAVTIVAVTCHRFRHQDIKPSSDDLHKASQPLTKTAAARQKPLRHEAILAASLAAEPIVKPSSKGIQQSRKSKPSANGKQLMVTTTKKRTKPAAQSIYDVWAEPDVQSGKEVIVRATSLSRKPRSRRASRPTPIAAVEIDAGGSSFNPDAGQHQAVVADAVKQELRKQRARVR